jgi:fatty-acyl-CoA synthase
MVHKNIGNNDLFQEHVSSIDRDTPLSILLTSGSTGQPKAVILTNFTIMNSTRFLANHFGTFCLRYCAPLSMVHISTGLRGTVLPSATMCTVIIPAQAYDPEAIMHAIDEEKCT